MPAAAGGENAGELIPPTSTPEPRCAPSTGPTSVQNSGSCPNSAVPSATSRLGVVGCLGVLDDPVAGAALVQLAQVGDHPLERAPVRAHPSDRRDLRAEREDRLDLQRRAHQRLRGADAPAPAQVLERVEAEPDVEALAAAGDGCRAASASVPPRAATLRRRAPGSRARRRRFRCRAPRPRPGWCSSARCARLRARSRTSPTGRPRCGRDDVAAGADERLVAVAGSRPPTAARSSAAAASRCSLA